ncbi:MAG: methionyl-tRNA formyltransferase [Rhodospirillaceae bacterium]|nr:methionyl-tRNA formyltransferase [Rhodospirillaceae bacterium]
MAECKLRLVFFGTPDFAVPVLAALINAGHEILCVYSQPPRRSGRGMLETPSPVHQYATEKGITVRTPESLSSADVQAEFAALKADAGIVVAYGLILPPSILAAPKLGCLNVHASLLPRWRGAAPIQRAIIAGDRETGVTIMQMDAGLDTGDILLIGKSPITDQTTAESLHDELAAMGAELIVRALKEIDEGTLIPRSQNESQACYAEKLKRGESQIDWRQSAEIIERKVRALNPWPGFWFDLDKGVRIRVLAAELCKAPQNVHMGKAPAGQVLDDNLCIACGEGAVRLRLLQRQGKSAVAADAFLRGFQIAVGTRLSLPQGEDL